jgi:hypothetical protein
VSAGDIEIPVAQSDDQIGNQRRVLGRTFDHRESVLGAVDADTQRHHTGMLGEVDAVDHHRDEGRSERSTPSRSASGGVSIGHKPRDTDDFDVDVATLEPTPLGSAGVDSLANMRATGPLATARSQDGAARRALRAARAER